MSQESDAVLRLLGENEEQIATEWLQEAGANSSRITEAGRRSLRTDAGEILRGVRESLQGGADPHDFQGAQWSTVRDTLESLSRSRAAQGQSAGDTSAFVLAFK